MTRYSPTTEADVAEAVRAASAAGAPLRILGGGTRADLGRPVQGAATLSLAGLSGITLYEPAEMVIGALAGTPLKTVLETLEARGQMLPFEPMDHRPLLGSSGEPTIGAVAAGNISGPRRISAGAARDSLIGVRFVNGRGEIVKNGGRVMKNVTGLDLVKLQAGAFGTLGVLTEVIFKVLPKPETAVTLVLSGLDDARAIAALSAGLTTPFEISGAAHWPEGMDGAARTFLRLEGFDVSIRYRIGELTRLLAPFGAATLLEGAASADAWQRTRDCLPLVAPADAAVWRLSVKPSQGPEVVSALKGRLPGLRWFYDWGGGLVWLATAATGDGGAGVIRAAVARTGGHATLVRAPAPLRAAVPVFQPEPAPLAALAAGIRASVDPSGIFNPGLMG